MLLFSFRASKMYLVNHPKAQGFKMTVVSWMSAQGWLDCAAAVGWVIVILGFRKGSAGKESACNAGDLGSIPWLVRSPGEGKGYPLQYSGRENSMGCIGHGVAKSCTTEQLSLTHSDLDSLILCLLAGWLGVADRGWLQFSCTCPSHSLP